MDIPIGNGHIGEVCRGIYKQTKGYTWWYVPSHPEAYYQGDLTELNFNDLNEDGTGASRGFDVIDTETGKHEFVDLTKDPYNIPTFNQIDLDKDTHFDLSGIHYNYYKLTTQDKDKYEKLSQAIQDSHLADQIQLLYIPEEKQVKLDVDVNASDKELVAKYCDENYPNVKDKALKYLQRASEN